MLFFSTKIKNAMKDEFIYIKKSNNLKYVCILFAAIEEKADSKREKIKFCLIRQIHVCSDVDKEQETYFQGK